MATETLTLVWIDGGECCAECCHAATKVARRLGVRCASDTAGRSTVTADEHAEIDAAVRSRKCCDPCESHIAEAAE